METAAFNALVGDLEYPMFIVTARAGEERLGCLVGFATQLSIHPPRFLVGLSHKNRTFRRGRDATELGVHLLPADREARRVDAHLAREADQAPERLVARPGGDDEHRVLEVSDQALERGHQ